MLNVQKGKQNIVQNDLSAITRGGGMLLLLCPDTGIEVEIIDHFNKQCQEPEALLKEGHIGRGFERPQLEKVLVHAYGNADPGIKE